MRYCTEIIYLVLVKTFKRDGEIKVCKLFTFEKKCLRISVWNMYRFELSSGGYILKNILCWYRVWHWSATAVIMVNSFIKRKSKYSCSCSQNKISRSRSMTTTRTLYPHDIVIIVIEEKRRYTCIHVYDFYQRFYVFNHLSH